MLFAVYLCSQLSVLTGNEIIILTEFSASLKPLGISMPVCGQVESYFSETMASTIYHRFERSKEDASDEISTLEETVLVPTFLSKVIRRYKGLLPCRWNNQIVHRSRSRRKTDKDRQKADSQSTKAAEDVQSLHSREVSKAPFLNSSGSF